MINLKTERELEKIRASGRIAAEAMALAVEAVAPGVTTGRLDQIAARHIAAQGGIASALNYRGYPKSICVSVNDEVVHGIPGERVLEEGDILSIDIAVKKDGYHGDMNVSVGVGQITPAARRLIDTTRKSLDLGIEAARLGQRLGDLGHAIQEHVEGQDYGVVREYCGHGIGRSFHEEPQLLHFGQPGTGQRLRAGMVFTIEPMVTQGDPATRVLEDDWTAVTCDGLLAAQFEHTVAITRNGPQVLTRFDDLPF